MQSEFSAPKKNVVCTYPYFEAHSTLYGTFQESSHMAAAGMSGDVKNVKLGI